jgi:uncharacterized protein YoaH (UPF0181 family)
MCPACMASAALMAGSVMSTGGVAAIVVKMVRSKKSEQTDCFEECDGKEK